MDTNLLEISDGKFYSYNDMVKVGCRDCEGCSECCQGMGQSILLDPLDAWNLTKATGRGFSELLEGPVELHVEEELILPNMKMAEGEQCTFLNEKGRCQIHEYRPGICRLFPLGRNYKENDMEYFLLKDACMAKAKTKVKVDKWLGVLDVKKYHQFLVDWHALTKAFRGEIKACQDDDRKKQLSTIFLQLFYLNPYPKDDFYEEFYSRRNKLI